MEFVPAIALIVMIKKIIDYARVLIPDHLEAKVLIPVSWVIGVALSLLFSASDIVAERLTIFEDVTLATADIALVVIYGLILGSGAGVVHDFAKPTTPPHDGT